ncbi:hypothetical protein UNSWCS_2106 [Campylobacter concisus UNSWCS]|uniref:Uncharacterized protein n=1 Tax=Campylobacter concisus UNSWCS TaxID=1242968 RepID=U2F6X2_9BACT|nr:hypothetical protein UNSWCS_2106 [Campylobacter concisus UNSWCS]
MLSAKNPNAGNKYKSPVSSNLKNFSPTFTFLLASIEIQ